MALEVDKRVVLKRTRDDRWWINPGMTGVIVEIEHGHKNLEKISDGTWEGDPMYHVKWDKIDRTTIVNPEGGDIIEEVG